MLLVSGCRGCLRLLELCEQGQAKEGWSACQLLTADVYVRAGSKPRSAPVQLHGLTSGFTAPTSHASAPAQCASDPCTMCKRQIELMMQYSQDAVFSAGCAYFSREGRGPGSFDSPTSTTRT